MSDPKLFLVAGEASGDKLGGALIAGLQHLRPDVEVSGVGGTEMQALGLQSMFPMEELSVMGLAEVLPKLRHLMRRVDETAEAVIRQQPDALITIDSPDFGLRVARKVKQRRPDLPTIHYVAPSVWAWRPGRARKMARWIDHVLTLLPFEPPYMTAAGMSCDFVGHPVVGVPQPTGAEVEAYRMALGLVDGGRLLAVLPGSRRGEIERLGPIFRDVCQRLSAQHSDLRLVLPTLPNLKQDIETIFQGLPVRLVLPATGSSDPEREKRIAFAAADAALAASGTVSLELAAAGTPMVIAYNFNALTTFLIKRLVSLQSATLANILTGENAIPEFLFENCKADSIIPEIERLLYDPEAAREQLAVADKALSLLGRGQEDPGLRAARSVLSFIEG